MSSTKAIARIKTKHRSFTVERDSGVATIYEIRADGRHTVEHIGDTTWFDDTVIEYAKEAIEFHTDGVVQKTQRVN